MPFLVLRPARIALCLTLAGLASCSTTDASHERMPDPPPPPARSSQSVTLHSAPPTVTAPTTSASEESAPVGALTGSDVAEVAGTGGLGLVGLGSGGGAVGGSTGIQSLGQAQIGTRGGVGVGYGSGTGAIAGKARGNVNDAPAPAPGGTFVHAGTNPIVAVAEDPLSTFAVDVDTGSYFYARRFLEMGRAPAPASVRVEEWVNALGYAYAPPREQDQRFAIHLDAAPSPFTKGLTVVRVALKGKVVSTAERKPAHIVFLVDVSGSMSSDDKLEWAKESMERALTALRDDDSVAIATYAGGSGVALRATSARHKDKIREAIRSLRSGGGTAMGSGMELAYREATKELSSSKSARVIVLSDGDANIGDTTHHDILAKIRGYVSEGVTMSTIGYGTGNYNDHLMEQLADAGNGTYTYIGSKAVMQRVFVDELTSTLEMIAQDVKVQVEWNPQAVESYRLLGYENRDVADKDFRNDKKDAGEIGAGHAVTALYEVRLVPGSEASDLATVRVRAKAPRTTHASETAQVLTRSQLETSIDGLDADAKAALGAALAAEVLRGSSYAEGLSLADAARLLREAAVGPFATERRELADLLDKVPSSSVAHR